MSWDTIMRDAQRQAMLSQKRVDYVGLEKGQYVAWALYNMGKTEDFSEMHRVAVVDGEPETFCGEKIPPSVCRVDFAAWPVNPFRPCSWCATGYLLSLKGAA